MGAAALLDSAIVEAEPPLVLHHHHDVSPLPSPADLDTRTSAPLPLLPLPLAPREPPVLSNTLPSPPPHLPSLSVTTPLAESVPHPNMNLIVGGALAPVPNTDFSVDSPSRSRSLQLSRPGPLLHLPSFRALGIASPHPNRFGVLGDGFAMKDFDLPDISAQLESSHLSLPPHQQDQKFLVGGGRTRTNPFRHDVATLTPPAETGDVAWSPAAVVSHPIVDSPATDRRQLGADSSQNNVLRGSVTSAPMAAQSASVAESSWIDGALRALLESLRAAALPTNPLRVLSHALPSPSTTGHIFPTVIDVIHGSTPAQPTVWINVFHAIQGRFNLADLPRSPPSTPGPAIGGDDYFTQKVFDTAVPISNYQQDLSSLPRSPHPIVPPSSINVSIVERYIPPSTTHEFADMFNHSGPSILVDRLVELSPNNGTLIFIYPTKAGAETFMKEYLGPLLDPQLRSLVVLNGLSSNLSRSLGRMNAVDSLPTYEQMHWSMSSLCTKLTQRSSTIERFHGRRATFSLVYASCEEVHLRKEAWSKDWWVKQEKQRIRDVMTRYAQEAQKTSSNEYLERSPTPTELIQQLLDGVTKSSYPPGQEPTGRIELSVFVIQRSD